MSYYFNNQHDEALKAIQTTLNANLRDPTLMMDVARVYLYLGMHNKVIQITERFFVEYEDFKEAPRPSGILAIAYHHVGELDKANQILKKLQERSEKTSAGSPSFYIAMIYAVDRLLDMFRTSTNVMGDAVGAVIVNRLEAKNLGEEPATG